MRLIRDDAKEIIEKSLLLLQMARITKVDEMREQHLSGIDRHLTSLLSSMKGELIEKG